MQHMRVANVCSIGNAARSWEEDKVTLEDVCTQTKGRNEILFLCLFMRLVFKKLFLLRQDGSYVLIREAGRGELFSSKANRDMLCLDKQTFLSENKLRYSLILCRSRVQEALSPQFPLIGILIVSLSIASEFWMGLLHRVICPQFLQFFLLMRIGMF